ncbi:MAG: hypothetical protein ACI4HQ_06355 [Acetatifactor sp.]
MGKIKDKSSGKTIWIYALLAGMVVIFAVLAVSLVREHRQKEAGYLPEKNAKEAVYIGETSIGEYVIVRGKGAGQSACQELQMYINRTCGEKLSIKTAGGTDRNTITLSVDEGLDTDRKIRIDDGKVSIVVKDKDGLGDGVRLFVNTYLGWIKAGTEEEHISNTNSVIRIPGQVAEKTPWIEEREPIVTLWNINWSRGTYMDSAVSVKNNILYFTEDQLYEYVKMMKFCGFTGIQVTDMCSAWAGLGSWEAVHEKLRILAEAAHSLDMKFTLWVWGAEFADCGWVDNTVVYRDGSEGKYSYESEEALATFEKYYDIYADLADCCDRVIGHYYDPGNLYTAEEIAFYAKMLRDKFLAINPDIDFGVSCWVDAYDKQVYVDVLGTDITLYENGYHQNPGNEYANFRVQVAKLGCRAGTWAWNTCEMEIDQLAAMHFNMDFIRSVYDTARMYDSVIKPTYWSEMDSYHVLNVFSLYCAAQMLIDPDISDEELFEGISYATVGEQYADSFADMLDIIQDARTGSSAETYFWNRDKHILKSPEYPAEELLERCNRNIPVLQEMIDSGLESNTLPLPISLQDVLRMMLPHLEQIRSYAEFRIGLAELEEDYAGGLDSESVAMRIQQLSDPIDNYNCIIGAWGQIEARAQHEMIAAFCEKAGVDVPEDPAFHAERKIRIYMQFVSDQLGKQAPVTMGPPYYQLGLAYGEDTGRLVQELVDEGLLIRNEDGSVYLSNWESYIYNF